MSRTEAELNDGLDPDYLVVIQNLKDFFVRVAGMQRGRATHTFGAAAFGTARVIVPADFPPNDFFAFGKTYPVILRHSKPGQAHDDASLDGGATSIKFFETDATDYAGNGFHDIMMNTGRVNFVKSARSFLTMVTTPLDAEARIPLLEKGIVLDDQLTEGYRTGSFTEFYYHAQICFEFVADDGARNYIRFRMIPGDRGPERGLFPASIRAKGVTFSKRWEDDARATDFMRRDFQVRVNHLGVGYILQCQLRPMDDPEALDPTVNWDERNHPWTDLVEIHLNKTLSDDEMDRLEFDANRTHSSINLPLARSADEHASLGHVRPLVYWLARQARANPPTPHTV